MAQAHANELHLQDNTKPTGTEVVPREDPQWNYQFPHDFPDRRSCSHMITCLRAGLKKAGNKAINYDKIKEITQDPSPFATRLNLTSPEGTLLLNVHFISQLAPDICRELQKLDTCPQTPQRELLNTAFKVFNNRDKEQKLEEKEKVGPG